MKKLYYSNTGTRPNNEDQISSNDFAFVLCDGVGGIDKGEVASIEVSESFIKKIALYKSNEITSTIVQNLIAEVQTELNQKAKQQPELNGIGTTFCAAVFTENELICAHIGDSRIYVIDTEEEKYWRTTDHSVSGELIKLGIIEESKNRNHPRANQLTRAIQAIPDIEPVKADIRQFNKIDSRHLIFICSDGVNEVFDDEDLVGILSAKQISLEVKFNRIKNKCEQNAQDNNSAILILPEGERDHTVTQKKDDNPWIYLKKNESTDIEIGKRKRQEIFVKKSYLKLNCTRMLFFSVFLIIILILIISFIIYQ